MENREATPGGLLAARIDEYISELLHIEEVTANKMIDLSASKGGETLYLTDVIGEGFARRMLDIVRSRYGKIGNTVLRNSSSANIILGEGKNILDWHFDGADDDRNLKRLSTFIKAANKELTLKGANPLFLSIGAVKWTVPVDNATVDVLSPLLIFPIRFTRTAETQPVNIEFVDDDIRLNECFLKKLESVYEMKGFPLPPPFEAGKPLDLEALDIAKYFEEVRVFCERAVPRSGTSEARFEFLPDTVAVATFRSGDIAMYYDILRNRQRIEQSSVVQKMLIKCEQERHALEIPAETTLDADSVQEDIITRVVNGDDLVVKGPPGTGKTLTIANLISALMAAKKSVLFVSAKNSALAEVCKKMPEELDPFILKLFCESEADAAKLSVVELTRALKESLNAKCEESETLLMQKKADAQRRRLDAIRQLNMYLGLNFADESYASHSYYQLIEGALRHEGLDMIPETFPTGYTSTLAHEDFLRLRDGLAASRTYLETITEKGEHKAIFCPWFRASEKYAPNLLKDEIDALRARLVPITAKLDKLFLDLGLGNNSVSVFDLFSLINKMPSDEDIVKLFGQKDDDELFAPIYKAFSNAFEAVLAQMEAFNRAKDTLTFLKGREYRVPEEGKIAPIYNDIPYGQLLRAYGTLKQISQKDYTNLAKMFAECDAANEGIDKLAELIEQTLPVMEGQRAERDKCFEKYASSIAEIVEDVDMKDGLTQAPKMPLLSFKAKGGMKKFTSFGITEHPTPEQVFTACYYFEKRKRLIEDKANQCKTIKQFYGDKFTHDDFANVGNVIRRSGRTEIYAFTEGLCTAVEEIMAVLDKLTTFGKPEFEHEGLSVSDILLCNTGAILRAGLNNTMKALSEARGCTGIDFDDLRDAMSITSLVNFKAAGLEFTENNVTILGRLRNGPYELMAVCEELSDFVKKYSLNPIFADPYVITPYALSRFAVDIHDSTKRNACLELNTIYSDPTGVPARFLVPFLKGDKKVCDGVDLGAIFEHTYYNCACQDFEKMLFMNNVRFDRDKLTNLKNQLTEAERDVNLLNKQLIRARCITSNPGDRKFAFLKADRPAVSSARRFFSEYSSAIVDLAKCVVLSPYSVSVFMRPEAYSNYDVLIIDEASQLPPQTVIPAAFRAKQIILVGDEWQMPPIRHFVKDGGNGLEDGYEKAESALDLAIRNTSIDIVGLQCHYRSQNEALIAFSQSKYYPDMTTFPTVAPLADNMGLRDIYIDNGVSTGAKNEQEADEVMKQLRRHFDLYYDPASGKLKDSVGIVVFGQNQMKLVQSKINADKELSGKLDRAISNFDGNPEKLFFITTVEAVQGQEVSHLIVSLTYGRNESGGTTNAFGTLNRGGLGERVFNVAVTRACKSLTMIHSIKAEEITSPQIQYIHDYLVIVRRLATDNGAPTFVSDESRTNAFTESVKRAIIKMGIDERRIIVGYGVTERSLRVPIVITSSDGRCAELGIFCEMPTEAGRFLDNTVRYPGTMERRGWKLHPIYIHDWFFNRDRELRLLEDSIRQNVFR